ncbi:hypothetical protein TRSC58_07306 [Trypanosoma rangeli SC58]|uniref:Uncharacterized protein n=1 Tax=Trypanosoma rangeli SC58 TaxID=429131 RepID=A0A061IS46_TRYRA|nr:hypothetical protein TRSC58_07306 [Trypanosoma rangeli SC58]
MHANMRMHCQVEIIIIIFLFLFTSSSLVAVVHPLPSPLLSFLPWILSYNHITPSVYDEGLQSLRTGRSKRR